MAPAATPRPIVDRLSAQVRQVRARAESLYAEVPNAATPAVLPTWLRTGLANGGEVIRRHGLTLE